MNKNRYCILITSLITLLLFSTIAYAEAMTDEKTDFEEEQAMTAEEYYDMKWQEIFGEALDAVGDDIRQDAGEPQAGKVPTETEQKIFRPERDENEEVRTKSSVDGETEVITIGVGTASIEVTANMPENIFATVLVQFTNQETGDIYEMGIFYEHGYIGSIHVPKGNYRLTYAAVSNDHAGAYHIETGAELAVAEHDESVYQVALDVAMVKSNSVKNPILQENSVETGTKTAESSSAPENEMNTDSKKQTRPKIPFVFLSLPILILLIKWLKKKMINTHG